MKQIIFALGAFSLSLIALSCADNKPANNAVTANAVNRSGDVPSPLPSATIDELASGRKVYEINCANCHKPDGKGGPVEIEGKKINPENLTSDKIKRFTDEKIIGYIVKGIEDEGMPSFKDKLSEGEIRDVVKYLRAEIQKMPGK
jgi:mono/diheme cytochrome c family protein